MFKLSQNMARLEASLYISFFNRPLLSVKVRTPRADCPVLMLSGTCLVANPVKDPHFTYLTDRRLALQLFPNWANRMFDLCLLPLRSITTIISSGCLANSWQTRCSSLR